MMIIRIICEKLYRKALFLYISLLHFFSQTMIKNHKVFGNTSIIIMVGKVILLLVNAQHIIEGCYNFRESSTILGYN